MRHFIHQTNFSQNHKRNRHNSFSSRTSYIISISVTPPKSSEPFKCKWVVRSPEKRFFPRQPTPRAGKLSPRGREILEPSPSGDLETRGLGGGISVPRNVAYFTLFGGKNLIGVCCKGGSTSELGSM
ncbi:hypothetical protein JTE90_029133 [Oedothorax gibbosus]|uniref:Uncharacterized protein n=1 Tax=Oedothorax gibbosus TaxID=931172 RepID=A0AAV6UJN7_9ARAC|nr:hypothetical protein JTE90_029133 [Oedothorax gibbosus]